MEGLWAAAAAAAAAIGAIIIENEEEIVETSVWLYLNAEELAMMFMALF